MGGGRGAVPAPAATPLLLLPPPPGRPALPPPPRPRYKCERGARRPPKMRWQLGLRGAPPRQPCAAAKEETGEGGGGAGRPRSRP